MADDWEKEFTPEEESLDDDDADTNPSADDDTDYGEQVVSS